MPSSLLSVADFRWFLAGQTVSLLGSAMAPVALTFAVLDASSGSAGDLGVVLAARMVPLLAFLLVGGATADRFGRRAVLVAANLGAALTQGAVAALLLTGHYALLPVAGLEVLNGVLAAFTAPALRGVVPDLVGAARLRSANALLGSVRNAAKVLGPGLSGGCVVVVGGGPAIAFDALTYLVAAGCLARVSPGGGAPARSRSSVAADIRDGWREFRRVRWVWLGTLSFFVVNLVQTGTWQILGPALTRQTGGAAAWGVVLSVRGAGLLVAGAVLYRLAVRRLLGLGQLTSALGALPLLVLGARLGPSWLVAGAFIAGLGVAVTGVAWDTSLQEHVPPHALSRVSSYNDLLSYVAIPVGQLCVAPLARTYGGFRVAAVAGAVSAVAAVLPLASGAVRRLPHGRARDGEADGAPAAPGA
ncbi:MFS transporter [Streptomyces sp. GS7]|uniref:MFS transporter n=1 Tax=Streptomyces sp. GS7 TaxID=2692234 RepID=UPI0013191566|nr:MFS transporter [Streptomyces sp. GS7]QHC24791.1 MFS transporter [Streptomyces sp. GS7]